MCPGGAATSPMMLSAVTLLPQFDSLTIPSVRPRSSEVDAVHRRTSPSSVSEGW
jgi:hypothetical protein